MEQKLAEQVGPYFGDFGGRFVPESLIGALDELDATYQHAKSDPAFISELAHLHKT
jgi:tryptophan synthase beta chain